MSAFGSKADMIQAAADLRGALEARHEYPDNQPRAQHIGLLDCS
jgi:hypothetical protein